MQPNQNLIMQIYHTMLEHFGPRGGGMVDEDISYQEMQNIYRVRCPLNFISITNIMHCWWELAPVIVRRVDLAAVSVPY